MANYLRIIEEFFPDAVVKLSSQDPSVYTNITWDTTQVSKGTLDQYINKSSYGVKMQFGDKVGENANLISGINSTGSTIMTGTPVYSTGTDSVTGWALIAPSNGSNPSTLPSIGVLINDTLDGKAGLVCAAGITKGTIDASNMQVGDILFVAPGTGITNIKPNLPQWQEIGQVIKISADSEIMIKVGSLVSRFTQRSLDLLIFGTAKAPYMSSTSTSYTTVARFIFRGTQTFGIPTNAKVIAWTSIPVKTGAVRLYDITNSTVIATSANFSNTTAMIIDLGTITNLPPNDSIFEFQIISTVGCTVSISSAHIYFN